MELQKSLLTNVNTEILKTYLSISMSVTKSETLNFSLTSTHAQGISNNESDSIYKKWSVALSELAESVSDLPSHLKCSIYKGDEFSKKILSYFGQTVNIRIFHDGFSAKQFDLFKVDENGRVILKITVLAANADTAFIDYEQSLIDGIFAPPAEDHLVTFNLDNSELSLVNKLSSLSTNPDKKTNYVRLYTDEGCIKATDNAFDVVLHETDVVLNEDVEIEKKLWSMIGKDQYEASVYHVNENKFILCKSKTKDVKITIVLLTKVDDTISFDDFENTDTNWDT